MSVHKFGQRNKKTRNSQRTITGQFRGHRIFFTEAFLFIEMLRQRLNDQDIVLSRDTYCMGQRAGRLFYS